jgi:hypothetical protein
LPWNRLAVAVAVSRILAQNCLSRGDILASLQLVRSSCFTPLVSQTKYF